MVRGLVIDLNKERNILQLQYSFQMTEKWNTLVLYTMESPKILPSMSGVGNPIRIVRYEEKRERYCHLSRRAHIANNVCSLFMIVKKSLEA